MTKIRWIAAICLALSATQPVWGQELSPEQTVQHYLTALKEGKFAEAYPYVSKDMAQNKSKEDWAKEQQWIMQMAEAKIFDFKVYPGKIEGNVAYVPDILNSQDKFLNQLGVVEHELYTLVREDGKWKINQQQIVEPSERDKWFPPQAKAKEKSS
jgi:hypothetical protein